MSIALVVTRGYGNGTLTGTIPDVVRRGYGVGEEIVVERTTGAWLSPSQVRNLRRIIREVDRAKEREGKQERRDRRRKRDERISELAQIFDEVHGLIPEDIASEVREIVEPFAESSDLAVPPPASIDFVALLADLEAVQRLADTLVSSAEQEESLILLMMS